uniref:Uncharacterized protein n=1 Tax=Octopus bimaculoides TaxID=37653 RepID=A0A0L8FJB4_OCTBM
MIVLKRLTTTHSKIQEGDHPSRVTEVVIFRTPSLFDLHLGLLPLLKDYLTIKFYSDYPWNSNNILGRRSGGSH